MGKNTESSCNWVLQSSIIFILYINAALLQTLQTFVAQMTENNVTMVTYMYLKHRKDLLCSVLKKRKKTNAGLTINMWSATTHVMINYRAPHRFLKRVKHCFPVSPVFLVQHTLTLMPSQSGIVMHIFKCI